MYVQCLDCHRPFILARRGCPPDIPARCYPCWERRQRQPYSPVTATVISPTGTVYHRHVGGRLCVATGDTWQDCTAAWPDWQALLWHCRGNHRAVLPALPPCPWAGKQHAISGDETP